MIMDKEIKVHIKDEDQVKIMREVYLFHKKGQPIWLPF